MKILHTSDWHIGKLVHGIHMTMDQKEILYQLIELIAIEKPDVLIIAGDVYDRSVPPIEGVELLDDILSKLIGDIRLKIIAISGNHDSPDRLAFASGMLSKQGLYISGHLEGEIQAITLEDEYGKVDFYPIPYAEPAIVREVYGDETIKSHDDAMKVVLDKIKENMDEKRRNVCIAHAFLLGTEGLETSESERPLSIGGSEFVNVDYFDTFDYVALGHLHRPQKVKKETIRYAGSLLKYSFSEALQKKSLTFIELGEKGDISIELKSLQAIRDMRVIEGNLKDLIDYNTYGATNTGDYIMARLTDEGELIDPIHSLRSVYPNILRLEKVSKDNVREDNQTSASGDYKQKKPLDLFQEFFENMTGEPLDDEKSQIVSSVMDGILDKGRKG